MPNREAAPKGRLTAAGDDANTCSSCGLVFHDFWEESRHRLYGRHHYRSGTRREPVRLFAPPVPVRELPKVDVRPQCHRCLRHADLADLVQLEGRLYHRGGGCET
jgi:hypothetical protein